MDSASFFILALLAIVWFGQYKAGNGAAWLKAKFMNTANPGTYTPVAPSSSSGGAASIVPAVATTDTASHPGIVAGFVDPLGGLGRVTGKFGEDRPGHQHAGVDLGVPTGTTVKAVVGGTISFAGARGDYGLSIDIAHGAGFVSRYGHLSELDVTIGQKVNAGQRIGLSGSTGRSTGPHLHFEWRVNGKAADPTSMLNRGVAGTVSGGVSS